MSFERYQPFYSDYRKGTTLRPCGQSASFTFSCDCRKDRRYKLFGVGETALFYYWKNEPNYTQYYRSISDSLDSVHARDAHFCLDFSSREPVPYPRRAYKKLLGEPTMNGFRLDPAPSDWRFGVYAKAENLRYAPGGGVRMRMEIYGRKAGVSEHDTTGEPDRVVLIELPEGSYDWQAFEEVFHQPAEEIAHLGVWLEGESYSGNLYFECPWLSPRDGEENLLPDFDVALPGKDHFAWSGQNLSRREWVGLEVRLNGQCIFRDEIFERCHLDSEWEINLPSELLRATNELEIRAISDYHDAVPYKIRELGVVEQAGGVFSLLSAARIGTLQEGVRVLLRTAEPDARVSFRSTDGKLRGEGTYVFAEPGLHGVILRADEECTDARFVFSCGGVTADGCVEAVIDRPADGIVTGTGDMIYTGRTPEEAEEYLAWYVSNGIGNLFTIRPCYRWGGGRIRDEKMWRMIARVLNELGIRYVHIVDGRELPGLNANPDDGMLAGPCYLGRQDHERDGAQWYWGLRSPNNSLPDEQFTDMCNRMFREDPDHIQLNFSPKNQIYVGDEAYSYRDPTLARDSRAARDFSVAQLAMVRDGHPRHSGPSILFKYLIDAGYSLVAAETMYTSFEPQLAFLRSASVYGKNPKMGVHHAVQWSSSPQDAPEHIRRYRLALYAAYLNGATDINTEEGLWHLEEHYSHFHRFSEACAAHKKQQQDFVAYVESHTRRGRFHTPVALVHGRSDGWHSFGHGGKWGYTRYPDSDAEKSWDLFRVFYPLSKPGAALYIHGCATDHAVGYYSGTPLGQPDVWAAEGDVDDLRKYPFAAFLGYHEMTTKHADNLITYLNGGGKLLACAAHFSDTTDFDAIARKELHTPDFLSYSAGEPCFADGHAGGFPVRVCTNVKPEAKVLLRTDEGLPFCVELAVGKGTLLLFTTLAYPADPAVRPHYERLLAELTRAETEKEPVWAEPGDDVEFACYKRDDGLTDLYLLAVDWFRPDDVRRTAVLRIGETRYTVGVPFGTMIKCVSDGRLAAWAHTESGDVLSLNGEAVTLRGYGVQTFTLAQNGVLRTLTVDFTDAPTKTVRL